MPKRDYSFRELDKLTAKVKGLWTWPTQGLINLYKTGFSIIDIDDFDIEEFVKNGGKYLTKKYGKEVGKAQIINSNIEQEKNFIKSILN